jgi:hypothetical protein
MENLHIKNVLNAPEIILDVENHRIEIKGESYPENAREFFSPVVSRIREYLEQSKDQKTTVNIELKYFNSSTAKILLNIFGLLDSEAEKGKQVSIHWIYDKRNMNAVEYGEDFKEDIEFAAFHLVPKDYAE